MGEEKDKAKTDKKTSEQKPALSKKAYVKLLAAELKRHTPTSADAQTGSIHVAFTVGASGRIVSHKVQSSSNPALEPVVGRILAAVHTPTPPGGAFTAVQEFNFH
jgi:outer membrane biosynthesis protein TonB